MATPRFPARSDGTEAGGLPVAAVQMVSGSTLQDNLQTAARLVGQAADQGAKLIALPEYFCLMGQRESDKLAIAEPYQPTPLDLAPEAQERLPIQTRLARLARDHRIWLVGGSIPLVSDQPNKVLNTCLTYDPEGRVLHRYDKLHLFAFSNGTESYDESRSIAHGSPPTPCQIGAADLSRQSVQWPMPLLHLAQSVCYDIRFPEFYRLLGRDHPLDLIVVTAAFTWTTGQAHWELLLRARAIENQCWLLASAQGGDHDNGRRTWGQSLLINPWGQIVAQQASGEGLVTGVVDPLVTQRIRLNLPAVQHRVLV
ncbi:carbon-nitrogen hydrolase family protein [Betaproteobacteria bacterium LSUCC0115]|nr:carbon-nitrogen hydrolase family protein [Burkholderiales bacterium LSUCC0115]